MPTIMDQVAAAKALVPAIAPEAAEALRGRRDVLFVDVRDPDEVAKSGHVAGAVNVSRGMLEFRADPGSPYHDPRFQKGLKVIVYCASGGRSALAGKALKELGYTDVHNLGGFREWADRGLPVEGAQSGG